MNNPLLILTLLTIVSLDINGITNLIRNNIIYSKESSCIEYTIVSSRRIMLTIMEAIVIVGSVRHTCNFDNCQGPPILENNPTAVAAKIC